MSTVTRRGFLGGLAAACAAALVPRAVVRAVAAPCPVATLPPPPRVLDLSSFDAMLKEYYRPAMVAALVAPKPSLAMLRPSKRLHSGFVLGATDLLDDEDA